MFYRVSTLWALPVLAGVLTPLAVGQSVISTHSGIVHFSEGAVYVDDQPLESHPGIFPSVPQDSELRTRDGRAEVLLTPNVFLRIGEDSAIRMLSNELSNARVELLAGSAEVDSAEPSSRTSVTLFYRRWAVRLRDHGVYRIDCGPGRLWALHGKVEVSSGVDQRTLVVEQGMNLQFSVLVPERSIDAPRDAFSTWIEGREQSIAAERDIAANTRDPASIQDPASLSGSSSGTSFDMPVYAYLPILGVAAAWIPHAFLSSTSHRVPAFPSSVQPGFTRASNSLSFRWGNGIQAVRLFREISAKTQLHLATPVRPVSQAGTAGKGHRLPAHR